METKKQKDEVGSDRISRSRPLARLPSALWSAQGLHGEGARGSRGVAGVPGGGPKAPSRRAARAAPVPEGGGGGPGAAAATPARRGSPPGSCCCCCCCCSPRGASPARTCDAPAGAREIDGERRGCGGEGCCCCGGESCWDAGGPRRRRRRRRRRRQVCAQARARGARGTSCVSSAASACSGLLKEGDIENRERVALIASKEGKQGGQLFFLFVVEVEKEKKNKSNVCAEGLALFLSLLSHSRRAVGLRNTALSPANDQQQQYHARSGQRAPRGGARGAARDVAGAGTKNRNVD